MEQTISHENMTKGYTKLGLFNVRVRLLKIKLWWTHKWFNIRYPVNWTYNLTWIKQYNVYLKKVHKIQDDIKNAL